CGPTTAAASSTTVSTTAIPTTVATAMATTMSVAVGICGACRTRLLCGCRFYLTNRLGQASRIKVLTRDLQADQTLDVAQQAVLVLTHQRYGKATGAGTTSATDAVHVVFRHVGKVMVDDHRQLVDVDAARGNVSGDPYLDAVVLEVGQSTVALRLTLVAVDGS